MVIYICLRLRKRRNVENIDNITTQLVSPNPYTGEYTGEKPYYFDDPPQQQQMQDINNGPSINN